MRYLPLQKRPLFGDNRVLLEFGYLAKSNDEELDKLLDRNLECSDNNVAPFSSISITNTQERKPLSTKRNAAKKASNILKRAKLHS